MRCTFSGSWYCPSRPTRGLFSGHSPSAGSFVCRPRVAGRVGFGGSGGGAGRRTRRASIGSRYCPSRPTRGLFSGHSPSSGNFICRPRGPVEDFRSGGGSGADFGLGCRCTFSGSWYCPSRPSRGLFSGHSPSNGSSNCLPCWAGREREDGCGAGRRWVGFRTLLTFSGNMYCPLEVARVVEYGSGDSADF